MHIRSFTWLTTCPALMLSVLLAEPNASQMPYSKAKSCTIEIAEDTEIKNTPVQTIEDITLAQENHYLAGYVQALIDTKFPDTPVKVIVRNGEIILLDLPSDPSEEEKIRAFVRSPEILLAVQQEKKALAEEKLTSQDKKLARNKHNGMWLPQSTILFPTQVANPRQISFSAGYRFRDPIGGQRSAAVSFGDQFPLYRWSNVWKWGGDLQLELEGGVFAVFNEVKKSSPLINADYYVGPSFTYSINPYAFRLRLYHISSHLGDEFIVNHPKVKRKNPSFEAIDLWTSYQMTEAIRIYGGPGVVIHSDSSYKLDPLYIEYGLEIRPWRVAFKQLYGQPFLAMHFTNWQEHHWNFDSTFALGWEWGKLTGRGRKIRLFLEYHEGFSREGQFSHKRADYLTLKLSYGF